MKPARSKLRLRNPPDPNPRTAASPEQAELFPQAYRSTLSGGARDLLPALRGWVALLVLVLALLLALSTPLWWRAVAGLRSAVEGALSSSRDTTPGS